MIQRSPMLDLIDMVCRRYGDDVVAAVLAAPPEPPTYDCDLCHDAGRVRVTDDIDDPRFGRTELCACVVDQPPPPPPEADADGRYPFRCVQCGVADTVPFQPRNTATLVCRGCYGRRKR